jgi:arginyl-tRNA synthetase
MTSNNNNNLFDQAKSQISDLISAAWAAAAGQGTIPKAELPEFTVEVPADPLNGDFSCNAAFVSAKILRSNPRKIADSLLACLNLPGSYFKRVSVAGPGFLNFYLSDEWYNQAIGAVLEQGQDYGKTDYGKGKRILVEFVSANPTGPMHIGNARGGALGDSLAGVLETAGFYVEREFYINDGGNQIQKFGMSLDYRYRQLLGESVELPEDAYHGADITENAQAYINENGGKLLDVSESERREALARFALLRNVAGLKSDLERYRIRYDTWFSESTMYDSGGVERVIAQFKNSGHTYEMDGALWFKASDFGAEKDIVLVRSNGLPTYVVPDIAYHYNKLVTRKFDLAIDVLGADHHGYIPRMNAALDALGVGSEKLKVIIMQMVSLVRVNEQGEKEAVKLSKRSGKAISLVTLLDEIPVDAARFFFNLRDADTHLEFDLDLAVEESSKNPVYYVQYAHARICRILEKFGEGKGISAYDYHYDDPAEQALIRKIAALPAEINEAAHAFAPSKLARYAMELAAQFHKFYDVCSIKDADESTQNARLALSAATKTALKNTLSILKVDAPEKM